MTILPNQLRRGKDSASIGGIVEFLAQQFGATDAVLKYDYAPIRVLYQNSTGVGNTGGALQDLKSYTVAGETLAATNDLIFSEAVFTGNAADNVTVNVVWGSKTVTVYSGAVLATAGSGNALIVRVWVRRTGAATQDIQIEAERQGTTTRYMYHDTAAETLSGDVVLKFQGDNTTDTSNDAVIQESMDVIYRAAP